MLSLLVFQPVTSRDYSQSSTQPYVWSPARHDAITWLLCYATATGKSNSASSTSCVWWYIAACTATHHLTWRTWSRRRPLQLSDLVSDLPHIVQSQCHFWHNVCVGGSTVKPAEWIWCISLYSNCDSSTIRVRFEHDSSTACYNTLRGFSCARIRVRYEHHTMRKRHPECAKTKLCFVTKFGPGRLAVVSRSLPQR